MKILHVNKFFDPFGGTETALFGVIEHQRQMGHEVHIFSTRSAQNLPSTDAPHFVQRFNYAIQEGLAKDLRKAQSFFWNREAKREMTRMIEEIRPDVIHLHNIYHHLSTSILAPIRASGIPCVQTLHDYKLACPNYRMFTEGSPCERCKGGRYHEAVLHKCLTPFTSSNVLAAAEMGFTKLVQAYERTVRLFLCPSNFLREKMIAWGEPASKLVVVPNAVDLPEEAVPRDGGYIFAMGRLSVERGFETLIRAAARVPECRVLISGTGPERGKLEMLKTSLSASNVELIGFVRHSERDERLRGAIALAHPSISYDNAPLAVLEAMAAGLPILGSRIGGIPELVEHEKNGWLIEPRDVEAWTEALRAFLRLSETRRTEMAEASRRSIAERFTWKRHLEQLFEVYARAGVR